MSDHACVRIESEVDIVTARQQGREMAAGLGFSRSEEVLIATAISEVARNILLYAKVGEIIIEIAAAEGRRGLLIVARDEGPGIADVRKAMQDGYSTSRGLGLGLPGSRRLMDEFDIDSQVGKGTTITMKKWVR